MSIISVSEARKSMPAVITSAATQAVTLHRHGRPVAVVVSPERYEELLDAEEDVQDLEAYDVAMADPEPNIPWEQVKADLGWL